MNRKAVLVFANPIGLDLARRRLPRSFQPLLSLPQHNTGEIAADFHLFTSGSSTAEGFQVHAQRGATFAERLESATDEIARLGYEEVVVVGSDCPNLAPEDIGIAFADLAAKRLVIGPDHRGGCYLIGFRLADRSLLRDVQWNRGRDREQLSKRLSAADISFLAVKQDVDNWADVRLLARSSYKLAALLATFFQPGTLTRNFFVDLPAQRVRVRAQIPPPALVA